MNDLYNSENAEMHNFFFFFFFDKETFEATEASRRNQLLISTNMDFLEVHRRLKPQEVETYIA